jgi:hypothetical protein
VRDSRSALDNPGVAHLIRTVVSRFQKAGAVVNPSSGVLRNNSARTKVGTEAATTKTDSASGGSCVCPKRMTVNNQ